MSQQTFWLLERGQATGEPGTFWWAGGDLWVSDVNKVPEQFRFPSIEHAQANILIEREERGGWPWKCVITEHSFIGD